MRSIKTTNIMLIVVLAVVVIGFVVDQFFTKLTYNNGFNEVEMKKSLSFPKLKKSSSSPASADELETKEEISQ